MTKSELAQAIFKVAHLKGHFLLRSGKESHEYFDKYRFEAQPRLLKEIARQLATLISPGTEILAGLEMGGIPIATALSLETGIPVVFVRKEAKTYGTCQFAEGLEIKGKKVLIIEDVITTGGQVALSTQDLRKLGADISEVLCVIHRADAEPASFSELQLKLQALFRREDFPN